MPAIYRVWHCRVCGDLVRACDGHSEGQNENFPSNWRVDVQITFATLDMDCVGNSQSVDGFDWSMESGRRESAVSESTGAARRASVGDVAELHAAPLWKRKRWRLSYVREPDYHT